MMTKESYRPIEKGLKGTDNCPVCGRAMQKVKAMRLGIPVMILACQQDDHHVIVTLRR